MLDLCKKLHIKPMPCYEKAYGAAMEDYAKNGTYIAEKQRVTECIKRYRILGKWEKELFAAAEEIQKDDNLLRYTYLLKHVLRADDVFDELLDLGIELPKNDEKALGYDFASLFSLFPLLPDMEKRLRDRNLPEDILYDSMLEFEGNADDFYKQFKKPGIRENAVWLYKFIHGRILRVGRLNFEIFKSFDGNIVVFENRDGAKEILLSGKALSAEIQETDTAYTGIRSDAVHPEKRETVTLSKQEWRPILRFGDAVVSVHIPSGGRLLPEACEASYQRMNEILQTYYPDYHYVMFVCEHSWLMDPHLTDFLPETANIMQFQKRYIRYRNNANGKGVFDFLFHVPHETPLAELPEDSSLRKAVKAHYLGGGRILEQGGLLMDSARRK